jgi:hypothetical protein
MNIFDIDTEFHTNQHSFLFTNKTERKQYFSSTELVGLMVKI